MSAPIIGTRTVNIGFVGCGSYNSCLAGATARSSKFKAIACADVNEASAKSFAQTHNIDSCSIEELLSCKEVAAVIIASPNNAHASNVIAAAQEGKHVFVDKPIANTVTDAKAMFQAVKEAGVVFGIGHNGRRMAGHRKMKEMIDAGVIGVPLTVEANFSHSGGLGLTPQHWRSHRAECPALPLMQLGVHFADTVQYLLGDVVEVSSFMTHLTIPADNDDVTVSLLRFATGTLGYLGSNYASPAVYYVNVYGTKGNLHCEGGNLRLRKADTDIFEPVAVKPVDTQFEELEEFADCILSGGKCEVDGEAAIKALAVVSAALKSSEEKRPVTIKEILAEA